MPLIRFIEPAFYQVLKDNFLKVVTKIVFRPPEPLSEYQLICVKSLVNRGLEKQERYDLDKDSVTSSIESLSL